VNDIITWDYAESVKTMKVMVMKWSTLTVEMVAGLYKAREALDGRGNNQYSNVPNGTKLNWSSYLSEVGLARTTVHNWLERYIPEENKLLTPEQLEERKQLETRSQQDKSSAILSKVKQFKTTGTKPKDWDNDSEKEYQKQKLEDIDREKRIEQAKKDIEKERLNRIENEKKQKTAYEGFSFDTEQLLKATSSMVEKEKQKADFKERIRISHEGKDDQFQDALIDYLNDLEDDNRRREACTNIIKLCKGIINDMEVKNN